jgi:hypothetical protein
MKHLKTKLLFNPICMTRVVGSSFFSFIFQRENINHAHLIHTPTLTRTHPPVDKSRLPVTEVCARSSTQVLGEVGSFNFLPRILSYTLR